MGGSTTTIEVPIPLLHFALVEERDAESPSRVAFDHMDLPTVPQQGDVLWEAFGTERWEVVRREFSDGRGRSREHITLIVRPLPNLHRGGR